jgi:hypothetical protein
MNPNFPKIWSSIFGDFKASSNLIVKNIKSKGRTCMGRMLYCVFFWAVLGSALCTLHYSVAVTNFGRETFIQGWHGSANTGRSGNDLRQ